jgi:hypothetical protein
LSFFDEADEPPRTETRRSSRTPRRPPARGRRTSGSGSRRPPGDQQAIQVRRAVALGALLIVVLLIALGIHSCDVSSTNSALQNYTTQVSSLNARSTQTGARLFTDLSRAGAAGSPTAVQNQINEELHNAQSQLSEAHNMSVPDQVRTGNQKFVLALQMRADGIANIANNIQPALGTSATGDDVNRIAAQTARFYASDVLYKQYAAPAIAGAVNAAGVRFSPLNAGQFVPNVQWLLPSYIASHLHGGGTSSSTTRPAPGVHGHKLNSVSVGGTTLTPGGTATVPASPAPTFTLNFTNTGTDPETNIVCRVTVSGTSVAGQAIVPHDTPGGTSTCDVKLSTTPPTGSQTVVAQIERVPGEKSVTRNSQTFTITFQ